MKTFPPRTSDAGKTYNPIVSAEDVDLRVRGFIILSLAEPRYRSSRDPPTCFRRARIESTRIHFPRAPSSSRVSSLAVNSNERTRNARLSVRPIRILEHPAALEKSTANRSFRSRRRDIQRVLFARVYIIGSKRKRVLFLFQANVRKPCNVTPDTSPPDVTSATGPGFCFRSRGF